MKTQNYTKQMKQVMFGVLTSLLVLTGACAKKNNSHQAVPVVPVPVTPGGCISAGCMPGGQVLYRGTTINGFKTQAQFEVYGNIGGNGPGSIAGVVSFNDFVCQFGMNNLMGPYQIQSVQQGMLTADVFQGYVNLVGPMGTLPAALKIVPSKTPNSGLFSLYVCNQMMDMNF